MIDIRHQRRWRLADTRWMMEIEQQIPRCFQEGGGVPHSADTRFQALRVEEPGRVNGRYSICTPAS